MSYRWKFKNKQDEIINKFNSLYLTFWFLKIKGYYEPIVLVFVSNTIFLKEATFGLYLIFSWRSPSDKKESSKSA